MCVSGKQITGAVESGRAPVRGLRTRLGRVLRRHALVDSNILLDIAAEESMGNCAVATSLAEVADTRS